MTKGGFSNGGFPCLEQSARGLREGHSSWRDNVGTLQTKFIGGNDDSSSDLDHAGLPPCGLALAHVLGLQPPGKRTGQSEHHTGHGQPKHLKLCTIRRESTSFVLSVKEN